MRKRKSYTDKDFNEQFPQPGVPADEAWKQMHELLLKNNLTIPARKDKRRRVIIFFILFCLLTGSGIIYFTAQEKQDNTAIADNNKSLQDTSTESNLTHNSSNTSDTITQQHFRDTLLQQMPIQSSNTHTFVTKDQEKTILYKFAPAGNNTNPASSNLSVEQPVESIAPPASTPRDITAETDSLYAAKPLNKTETNDSTEKNNIPAQLSLKKLNSKPSGKGKFHFGLEWNINFSMLNNSHYFDAYNGGKQYYMWLLPSAWAKADISKKHGIALHVNPYSQQFAGRQTIQIEKPFIASIEPDVVTKLIKSRGYNFGLDYEYTPTGKLTVSAGLNYTIQNKALYNQQEIIAFSGELVTDSIKAAGKTDTPFQYLKPAYLSWDASLKYNLKKISIGAGITKPITDISANPDFPMRPLNGKIYLHYHIK